MQSDVASAQFIHNLESMTKPCSGVGLLKISLDGKLIKTLVNAPGQSGSVRVLESFTTEGELRAPGISACLEVFQPLVAEARGNPGVHPIIDLLLGLGRGQVLRVESVQTPADLFTKLANATASPHDKRDAVDLLDKGLVRCAEKLATYEITSQGVRLTGESVWITQDYAVACMNAGLSAFPITKMGDSFYDKVPLKTEGWSIEDFERAGVRFIPGCFARRGAYIGSGTTIMPGGIVNIGAHIAGSGVMIDGGARVATGAQVGRGVKLGAGSGIEGILEPTGRLPSIIEDNVRIGANCEVCGIIEEGAVVASGVVMASGKKIFDLRTNAEVSPRYIAIGDTYFEIPIIPRNRVAVGGVYTKTRELGIDCIVLLEKDASESSLAHVPRNAQLYLKV